MKEEGEERTEVRTADVDGTAVGARTAELWYKKF